MRKHFILFVIFLIQNIFSFANNLQIDSVNITSTNGNRYINFNIGWNNSWRTSSSPFNWDAVWVFVKRRDCASLQWRHVNLSAQDSAHTTSSLLFVDAYADKKGVMIYRSSNGSGNINNIHITLKMDSVPVGDFDYQVHGIEMVYVPQGSFYVGDGGAYNSLGIAPVGPTSNPYFITGEQAIPIGIDSSKLYSYDRNGASGLYDGTVLPALYPKGFNSFYCMKYEISQGQYATFLNSITQDAFYNRYFPANGSYRYTIQGIWPNMQCSAPNRACNFLSFQDVTSYLDWSALSPMTELEFEKVCRGGNNSAVTNEKAWGSVAAIRSNNIAIGSDGTISENVIDTIPNGTGISNYAEGSFAFEGPLRCGFAAKANTDRYRAGATFYGVMEMSGNVAERCYNLTIFDVWGGGFFIGQHGDGELSLPPNAGFANVGWPETGFSTIYEQYAVAIRGGGWLSSLDRIAVSDRYSSFSSVGGIISQSSSVQFGGRGVSRRQQ